MPAGTPGFCAPGALPTAASKRDPLVPVTTLRCCHQPRFLGEKTEAREGAVTCPGPRGQAVAEPGLEPGALCSHPLPSAASPGLAESRALASAPLLPASAHGAEAAAASAGRRGPRRRAARLTRSPCSNHQAARPAPGAPGARRRTNGSCLRRAAPGLAGQAPTDPSRHPPGPRPPLRRRNVGPRGRGQKTAWCSPRLPLAPHSCRTLTK